MALMGVSTYGYHHYSVFLYRQGKLVRSGELRNRFLRYFFASFFVDTTQLLLFLHVEISVATRTVTFFVAVTHLYTFFSLAFDNSLSVHRDGQ